MIRDRSVLVRVDIKTRRERETGAQGRERRAKCDSGTLCGRRGTVLCQRSPTLSATVEFTYLAKAAMSRPCRFLSASDN